MDALSPPPAAPSARLKTAALVPASRRLAQQLETSFAAELLRAARPPEKSGLSGRGTGAQAFDSFMDEALGGALVARGGLGLAPMIERSIEARQGRETPR